MKIHTAVLPVAGLGTRFLPMTRAVPKELLPIVDRPVVHYALEEAMNSGIGRYVLVTARGKTVIEDHFDRNPTLERQLELRDKKDLVAALRDIPESGRIIYVRQGVPNGLGHAINCARHVVGDEPFAVLLPDDFIDSDQPPLGRLVEAYQEVGGGCLIGVQEVAAEDVGRYGIIEPDGAEEGIIRVRSMVEKPSPGEAPSRLAAVGRYILGPEIFRHLDATGADGGGEIQLTDALAAVAAAGALHAVKLSGTRYDCGSKIGFLQANIQMALKREDLAPRLRAFLATLDL